MNYSQNIVNWTMVQYSHFQLEKEMATHSKCSCLENPRDRGAWWAAVYGVAKSQTRLKRLSSSSSRECLSGAVIALFQLWLSVTGGGWSAASYLCSVLCSVSGPVSVLGYGFSRGSYPTVWFASPS